MESIGPAGRTAYHSDFGFRGPTRCARPSPIGTSKSKTARRLELADASRALNAIRSRLPEKSARGKDLDETLKQELLGRFAAYLDGLEHSEAATDATVDGGEEADLFSIFVELAALRNETRAQARLVKDAIDRFRNVFETLQSSHTMLEQDLKRTRAEADNRERILLKPLLLDIIDIRDRLAAGLQPAARPMPRWYERFRANRQHEAAQSWREG